MRGALVVDVARDLTSRYAQLVSTVARVLDLGADPRRRPLLYHRGAYGLLQERG